MYTFIALYGQVDLMMKTEADRMKEHNLRLEFVIMVKELVADCPGVSME